MTANHNFENGAVSSEHHNSSSSSSESSSGSTSSTSPPSTPPSPEAQNHDPEPEVLPRIHHAPHSSTPPRRGRGRGRTHPQTSTRLGAIDEHSSTVAPDVPTQNPARKIPGLKYFNIDAWTKPGADVPPPNAYDTIVGPRGEKFADVRHNRPKDLIAQGKRRRKKICFGLVVAILLIVAIALSIGLGVGLTRRQADSVDVSGPNTGSDASITDPQPFPLGSWSVPTYLTSTNTSCTSNSATWRCYPYNTYTDSNPSTSFSTLLWRITSPTNSTLDLEISNSNPTFSYPFTNQPLALADANDVSLSAFSFDFTYRKQVVPNRDITGDNGATRCYYNNTLLSVKLYNNEQGAGGQVVGPPPGTANTTQEWPYAVEYQETINEAPECFRYVNGEETDPVDVAAGTGGDCVCAYRNYGLS